MVETEVERAGKTSRERQNGATVRHVALSLLRGAEDEHSLEVRRKSAARDDAYLEALIHHAA